MKSRAIITTTILAISLIGSATFAATMRCEVAGPQTPRDITRKDGQNRAAFPLAPAFTEMNLCNIHTHTNAENKGPDFSIHVGNFRNGGYACNETNSLTKEQLKDPMKGKGAYKGVKPGDTIEVHWVYSSCDVQPGNGLGACLSDTCKDPKLRVESQVFLLVNDPYALDFNNYTNKADKKNGVYQARAIPTDMGNPIVFRGSTTGPSYNEKICSPAQVTWSIRPQCAKLDISSLHTWAESNVFNETMSYGVRQLVTNPKLLSPMER